MPHDFSLFSARAQRVGCTDVADSPFEQALRFNNPSEGAAADYVSLPGALPDAYSFTLRLWVRGENGGCHDYCCGGEVIPVADGVDPAALSAAQQAHTGVLVSNTTLASRHEVGLTIAHLAPHAYLTVQFLPCGAAEPVQFSGCRTTYDGRWHMITLTADRAGLLTLYVDDEEVDAADISAWKNLTLTSASFTVGADVSHRHGFGPGEIADFSMEYRVLPAEEVAGLYYAGALRLLQWEIAHRGLDGSPLYDAQAAKAFLQRTEEIALDENAEGAYRQLRREYEAFLLQTVQPDLTLALVSDLHSDGEAGGRTAAFRKGLAWANELGAEVLIDGGDYSNFGKDFELDSYWRSISTGWAGKPLFVTVGNHETLELKAAELVRYHCDHLRAQGMVGEGHDQFYYDGEYHGYHFIVLAQYSDTYTVTGYKGKWKYAADIKPAQLAFLREKLAAYCGQGKPVFLVIHNAVESLLARQTNGHYNPPSTILGGEPLYALLRDHPDVVLCTGHVHHGFGGGAGFHHLEEENYNVIDMPGFRGGTIGYGVSLRAPVGSRHAAWFLFVFGRTLLLRAVDFASGEWLTAYDQTVTLPE